MPLFGVGPPLYGASSEMSLFCSVSCLGSVTESQLALLAAQQANKSGDEVLRQGRVTLFGKSVGREDG